MLGPGAGEAAHPYWTAQVSAYSTLSRHSDTAGGTARLLFWLVQAVHNIDEVKTVECRYACEDVMREDTLRVKIVFGEFPTRLVSQSAANL